jgi:hypothetical protein
MKSPAVKLPALRAGLAGHVPVSVGAFSLEELKRSPCAGHSGVMGYGKQPGRILDISGIVKKLLGEQASDWRILGAGRM